MAVQGSASIGLSDDDRNKFLEIIESSLHIANQEDFLKWTQDELQEIFPHGKLVCGVGRIGKNGAQIRQVIGHNFPDEYIKSLQRPDGLTSSPIINKWLKEQQPILFEQDDEDILKLAPPGWLENFKKYGLCNLAAHGLSDIQNQTTSYFSFSCIPEPLTQRHAYLLKLLVPHMHVALMRVFSAPRYDKQHAQSQKVTLSDREKEILLWMSRGKSNWEIAQLIELSELTVKDHVQHILAKLNAATRTQAVVKAVHLKLISAKH